MIVDKKSYKEQIDSFVEAIPELSVTASQVVEICSRIDSTPEELSQVVSEDSVLSEHVLKLVNSAYYSLVSEVTSLTRAITMLGFNTVKSITLSKAVNKAVARLNFPQVYLWPDFGDIRSALVLQLECSAMSSRDLQLNGRIS